jgi:alkylhydroperoxidase family enzyme
MIHHGAGLRRAASTNGSAARVEQIIEALRGDELDAVAFDPADAALLQYADRLTRDPSSVRGVHIAELRAAGFGDQAIHDACAIVSYFAFVNRIANGLGVELEP